MKIALFNTTVTELALREIELEAEKYDGLVVDMNDKEARKFVKEQAADAIKLIKVIDRARIDLTANYKADAEKEAKAIIARIQIANGTFQGLLDAHKAERAAILAAEKAKKQAIEDAIQLELDHENGLMMNKVHDFEAISLKEAKERHEKLIADNAAKQAVIDEANRIKAAEAEQKRIDDLRAADAEHRKLVNIAAKQALIALAGLSDKEAENVIIAIARNLIPAVGIKY